jgi:hypothetical protein
MRVFACRPADGEEAIRGNLQTKATVIPPK